VWLKGVMWKKQIDRRSLDSSEAEPTQRWREQPGQDGKAHTLAPKVWVWPVWFMYQQLLVYGCSSDFSGLLPFQGHHVCSVLHAALLFPRWFPAQA